MGRGAKFLVDTLPFLIVFEFVVSFVVQMIILIFLL